MTSSPLKSGLGKEVYDKQMNKFDNIKFKQVVEWTNKVLDTSYESGDRNKFKELYHDGLIISRLILAINPNTEYKKKIEKELKKKLKIAAVFIGRIDLFNRVLKEMKLGINSYTFYV